MATLSLTDPFVRSLRPLSDKEAEYRDRNVRGLTLRLSAAGMKTWTVQYRVNGRTRRLTLGRYDVFSLADARKRAREALYEVAVGKDPAADRHDALHAETFADLAKEYMERHGKFKRSWREDQRMLYGSPHKKRTGKSAGELPRLVVSKILNHVETGITAVYDRHGYDAEKRAALDFWGDRLEAIIQDGKTGRVLRFEARR